MNCYVSFDVTSAMGAASGVQYDLLLAHDLSFLNDSEFQRLGEQVIEGETNANFAYLEADG